MYLLFKYLNNTKTSYCSFLTSVSEIYSNDAGVCTRCQKDLDQLYVVKYM